MNPKVPTDFHYFPVQASTAASHVDALYLSMVALSTFFCIAIPAAILYFCIKYRRRPGNDKARHVETSTALELTWTIIPFFLVIGMFIWGSRVYFIQTAHDPNALEILCTGKKWMWKFQHKNGYREIQDLHVPVNTPIRLKMASEDVIHSVFVPAFRLKQDVMPGRYTYLNFTPTRTGVYHLFCNQYCGTSHSNMIGKVIVMEQADYQKWLSGYTGESPEKVGEALFTSLACNTCHTGDTGSRGPLLNGLPGTLVKLANGTTVEADDTYLRESILNPQAKVVAGYQPIMPDFKGVVSQEQVNALIAYIKSLPSGSDTNPTESTPAVGVSQGEVEPRQELNQTTSTAPEATLPKADEPAAPTATDTDTSNQAEAPAPADAAAPAAPEAETNEQSAAPAADSNNNAVKESNNVATTAGDASEAAPSANDAPTTPGEQQGVQ